MKVNNHLKTLHHLWFNPNFFRIFSSPFTPFRKCFIYAYSSIVHLQSTPNRPSCFHASHLRRTNHLNQDNFCTSKPWCEANGISGLRRLVWCTFFGNLIPDTIRCINTLETMEITHYCILLPRRPIAQMLDSEIFLFLPAVYCITGVQKFHLMFGYLQLFIKINEWDLITQLYDTNLPVSFHHVASMICKLRIAGRYSRKCCDYTSVL